MNHPIAPRSVQEEAINRRPRSEAIHFNERNIEQHDCGPMNVIYKFCCSKNFLGELPRDKLFTFCCVKGKNKLPMLLHNDNDEALEYPELINF